MWPVSIKATNTITPSLTLMCVLMSNPCSRPSGCWGGNPDTLHHIAAKCEVDSEGYEGKMRYARLIVTPFPFGRLTYFLEFFNDWTDTLYELDLSAQMYEFFGSEPPLDRLNAVLCETGKS